MNLGDLAMRSNEDSAIPSWTDGIVQDYHRFMIVTADNENGMRRWIIWRLTDVFIGKFVGQTHPLRLVLHRLSIHDRVLELLHDSFVDSIALTFYQDRPMNKIIPPTKSSTLQAFFLSTTGVL